MRLDERIKMMGSYKHVNGVYSTDDLIMTWEDYTREDRFKIFNIDGHCEKKRPLFDNSPYRMDVLAGACGVNNGGDHTITRVNIKTALPLIEDRCPNLYAQEMK